MIPFACPSCRCPHIAARDFGGMHTRCFQCGVLLHIPAAGPASSAPPRPTAATGTAPRAVATAATAPAGARTQEHRRLATQVAPALPNGAARRGAAGGTGTSPALREQPPPTPAAPPPAPDTATAEASPSLNGTGPHKPAVELPWPETADAKKPTAPDAKKPTAKKATRAENRKRRRVVTSVASGVGAVALIAAVYAFGFTGSPKQPSTNSPDVARNNKEPEPPPQPGTKAGDKKQPTPPPAPSPGDKKQPTPPPAPLQPEGEFTMARLLAQWTEDPAAFDRRYSGKLVLVRGTCARTVEGEVILSDGGSESLHGELKIGNSGHPLRPPQPLQPGQPVTLRGKYLPGPRLTDCEVTRTTSEADDAYKGKQVILAGVVGQVSGATVTLEAPTTDCPITVQCVFEKAGEPIPHPGEPILLRGQCAGRVFRMVRVERCWMVRATDPPNPAAIPVRAERFFADYEADLLVADRLKPGAVPVAVTAEALAAAFQANPREAAATYRSKGVTLSGQVLTRDPVTRTVVFETGTGQRYVVVAAFTPSQWKAIPPDDTALTVRGTCTGLGNRGFIRIESAEFIDPDAGNPAARVVADFLPFQPGRELFYDRLTPEGARNNPLQRWQVKFVEPDEVRSMPVRVGTLPGQTLFASQPVAPRWSKDPPPKGPYPQVSRFRKSEALVEIAQAPSLGEIGPPWWDPVLKLGARKGQSWSTETSDGRKVEYTVMGFDKDESGKHQVEIKRVLRNPKDPGTWEESLVTYVHSVGEARRSTVVKTVRGQVTVVFEMKLVPPEPPGGP